MIGLGCIVGIHKWTILFRARRPDGGTCEVRLCRKCSHMDAISGEKKFVGDPQIPSVPFDRFKAAAVAAEQNNRSAIKAIVQ